MAFLKILDFFAWAQNSLQSSLKVLVLTEKVKTVIGCNFLLPDFKSRGQPTRTVYNVLLDDPNEARLRWRFSDTKKERNPF